MGYDDKQAFSNAAWEQICRNSDRIKALEAEVAQLRGKTVYTKVPVVAEGGERECHDCHRKQGDVSGGLCRNCWWIRYG